MNPDQLWWKLICCPIPPPSSESIQRHFKTDRGCLGSCMTLILKCPELGTALPGPICIPVLKVSEFLAKSLALTPESSVLRGAEILRCWIQGRQRKVIADVGHGWENQRPPWSRETEIEKTEAGLKKNQAAFPQPQQALGCH